MYALTTNEAALSAEFLVFLLRSPDFLDYATNNSSRANIPKLNREQLLSYSFDLPDLGQQRRVSTVLARASSIVENHIRAVSLSRQLSDSIFFEMFGDPATAEDVVRLGGLATLEAGRSLVAEDLGSKSRYRVLKISAVTTGEFDSTESKPLPLGYVPPESHLVREGDLLMSRANTAALVGAVAQVRSPVENLVLPDKVWRFVWRDSRSVPEFYRALLTTASVRSRVSRMSSGTGGSMKNIPKARLEGLELPIVSFERQQEFKERVGSIPLFDPEAPRELLESIRDLAFRGKL